MKDNCDALIDAAGVRRLFGGRSAMWLWRRIKDGTLPSPIRIASRNYWRERDVQDVIARGEQSKAAA